jgi:type I restriction enzyme R subunit
MLCFWRITLPAWQRRDTDRRSPLLKLRWRNAMADALSDLGSAAQIRQVFVGFQRHLYQG